MNKLNRKKSFSNKKSSKNKPQKRKNKKPKSSNDVNDEKCDDIESVPQNYVSQKDLSHDDGDDGDDDLKDLETRKMVTEQRKKKNKKSGGFQSMGLSNAVLKGILRKGYKVPTPIQRKAIPLILEGKDVVAMARTGSGKTAAFLVPLYERLKLHSVQTGVRALILSPTRELALQTYKFSKEIGRFTNLRATLILGGDSMGKQFGAIHENPDIIIATPGRFLHVIVEMNLKLNTVEYVVFDEADRLFEMGFKEQLNEILHRLPDHRQTLLFSATLPQLIVDFTKARLNDPILVRLDTESKLSDNLKTVFLSVREDDKIAILLHLLKCVIKSHEMTVVFVPTRHHVEYLKDLLIKSAIECTYLYSSLDQDARKMNIISFKSKKVKVMLVTDVAARGVDIPMLDNVVNFNFPPKPKLFVHRVGRVARAGRIGTAYSLVAVDEAPFVHSLHLFLNRSLRFSSSEMSVTEDGVFGSVPQNVIDEETELLDQWDSSVVELKSMKKVCRNAYIQYIKSRPSPAGESVKEMKEMTSKSIAHHPIFNTNDSNNEISRNNFLESIKKYRPNSTIFETGNTKKSSAFEIMQNKRKMFAKVLNKNRSAQELKSEECDKIDKFKDNEFYLNYQSEHHHSEKGLELEKPFNAEIASAAFDIVGDDADTFRKSKNVLKWDRKKKRFVGNNDNESSKKKIKTESGNWISASYKSNLYNKWKQKSKAEKQDSDEEVNTEAEERNKVLNLRKNNKSQKRPPKRELKTKEEILKERQKQERKLSFIKWRRSEKSKKKGNKNNTKKR